MARDGQNVAPGFSVEEFINSITTQLDRVQDALRLKSVNRPLTYALKELHLDLKVVVDMDSEGNVRLRPTGPNETGASVLSLDFTTVTRPMIEENTISLSAARSTPLSELGLSDDERARLERVGVTNLQQLNKLGASTGVTAVSRLTDVPLERLRSALDRGRPVIGGVRPAPSRPKTPAKPPAPKLPPSSPRTPRTPPPIVVTPRPKPPLVTRPDRPAPTGPVRSGPRPATRTPTTPLPRDRRKLIHAQAEDPERLYVPASTRLLTITGQNLLASEVAPQITLNGRPLTLADLDDDHVHVQLPEQPEQGLLEVRLQDGETQAFELMIAEEAEALDDDSEPDESFGVSAGELDAWAPRTNGSPRGWPGEGEA